MRSEADVVVMSEDGTADDGVLRALRVKATVLPRGTTAPRSGLLFAFPFLENCKSVDFYGYWPFDDDCDDNPIDYHYWHDETRFAQGLKNDVHDNRADFQALVSLVTVYNNFSGGVQIRLPQVAMKCKLP